MRKLPLLQRLHENTAEMSNEEIKKKVVTRNFTKDGMVKSLADTFEVIQWDVAKDRSNSPEVLLGKGVLKICSRFTRGHLCRSVISIKVFWDFFEIALRHGCSPVNLLRIFRTPF